MIRGLIGTILATILAACVGVGLFFIKHEVKDQERRLAALNSQIQADQESIHVLRAEWSYLNDPIRLRALSEKHLGMHPVTSNQVATLEGVLRDGIVLPNANGAMLARASAPSAPHPAPVTIAAHVPPPPAVNKPAASKPTAAKPAPQPVKLAQTHPRPKPADTGKGPPAKVAPVTLAKAAPPGPLRVQSTASTATPATTPARGGRSIVIQSPALAQSDSGDGSDGR